MSSLMASVKSLMVTNHGHWVLEHLAHLILKLLCRCRQLHHPVVVDVEDVVLVHDPPAQDLCGILGNPPTQRPTPDKDLQRVGRALLETFSLDAIRVGLRPEHGKACGAGHSNDSTSQQGWCRLYHEEPVATSTGGEKGQEIRHCHLEVDRRCD